MAYTGLGTPEQPYIVDNWLDFKTLCSLPQAYIAFDTNVETKVIDMNATEERKGLTEDLIIAANIIGNGWEIRNLVTNGYRIVCGENAVHIENLHFTNIINSSDEVFCGAFQFTRCCISGVFLSNNCLFDDSYGSAEECAFNLHCLSDAANGILFGNYHLSYCNIHLGGSMMGCTLVLSGSLSNCCLTGAITLEGGYLHLSNGLNAGVDRYNVVTLSVSGTGTVTSTSVSGACIANADLITGSIVNNVTGANWHALTTSQMQDADYLLNVVGFPCVQI